jgi:putative hydrolase of the HAD superfamily
MTARPMLDAVILDAGGTLIRLDFEWMAADLGNHGVVTISAEELRRAEVAGRHAYDASALVDGQPKRGDVRAYFGGMLRAVGAAPATLEPAVDRFLERERTSGLWSRPMEGARAALDAIGAMNLKTAVVSNSDGRAERHLAGADMLRGVEFVVDSHLVGIEKPDPAIFRVALDRLGTAPDRTLFVGDIRSVDEAGARAAGMRFVLIDPCRNYAAPDSPRIDGMHELGDWIGSTFDVAGAPR